MKPQRQRVLLAASVTAIGLSPLWARASDATWTFNGDGSWSDASNWLGGVPVAGSNVSIANNDAINRTINYDYVGGSIQFNSLTVSNSSGSAIFSQSGNVFNVATETIGTSGSGFWNMSGGTHNVTPIGPNDGLTFGLSTNGFGSGTISGGTLVVNRNEYVGYSGNGFVNQSAGTHVIAGSEQPVFSIGARAGSAGTYQLSGTGRLTVNGTLNAFEYIGEFGFGTFIQSGGVHTIGPSPLSNTLNVGYSSNSTGTYLLSGNGLLTTYGVESISGTFLQSGGTNIMNPVPNSSIPSGLGGLGYYRQSGSSTLIVNGTETVGGTFDQSGGDHVVGSSQTSGTLSIFSGLFHLSGSGSLSVNGTEAIGYLETGTFNQDGGTQIVGSSMSKGTLLLANYGTYSGIYQLSGTGSLTVNGIEIVGRLGHGTFDQNGGLQSIGSLKVGAMPGSAGTFLLSNSSVLTVNGIEAVGFNGVGTFIQSGGTDSISPGGALYVGADGGGTGTFMLSGGSLTVGGYEVIGEGDNLGSPKGTGTFIQTGGTHTIGSSLQIGYYSNGAYALGDGGSLIVHGDEFLGQYGTGTFTQTGGVHLVYGNETIGGLGSGTYKQFGGTHSFSTVLNIAQSFGMGTYSLAGGMLNGPAMSINEGGLFDFQAGTLSINSIDLFGGGQMLLTPGNDKVLQVTTLSIDGMDGSKLDLADNKAIVHEISPLPLTSIRQLIQMGYNNGAWNGAGISSSSATTDQTKALGYGESTLLGITTFGGVSLTGSNVLIKYTWSGDANLDGRVNIADLAVLAARYNTSGDVWTDGDFNYDGVVDVNDLRLLVNNWLAGAGNPLAPALGPMLTSLGLPDITIPEPESSLGVVGMIFMSSFRRRRRDRD